MTFSTYLGLIAALAIYIVATTLISLLGLAERRRRRWAFRRAPHWPVTGMGALAILAILNLAAGAYDVAGVMVLAFAAWLAWLWRATLPLPRRRPTAADRAIGSLACAQTGEHIYTTPDFCARCGEPRTGVSLGPTSHHGRKPGEAPPQPFPPARSKEPR